MHTTIQKLATMGIGAAAIGTAATLFLGAGTANAAVSANYKNNGFGTVVSVKDPANPPGAIEICSYKSHVKGNPFLFPYFSTVQLSGNTPSDLQNIGNQTCTSYSLTISCPFGGTTSFTKNF